MSRQRITRLTPLVDALARIEALVAPVAPREVETNAAVGKVLAADVVAPKDQPSRPMALRDGWAVRADDLADAGSYAAAPLPGIPHRLDAGETMPANADTVAPIDVVVERGTHAEAVAQATPGEGVLAAGGDVRAGDLLLRQGTLLGAADVAVFLAVGIPNVTVHAPRIIVENDRDELVARAVESEGGVVVSGEADAIIRIGGTGAGRKDNSVQRLAQEGRVEFHGVGIAPGETAAFGIAGRKPVLLLPGRLDARLAAWLMLGRPLLARLSGRVLIAEGTPVKLSRKVASSLGLAEVVPVRVSSTEAEAIASGYWPLAAVAQSDGWIVIPADSEGYPAGAEVVVRRWP